MATIADCIKEQGNMDNEMEQFFNQRGSYRMFDEFAEETEDITKAKYCFTYDTFDQMYFMYRLGKNNILHNLYDEDKGLSYFSQYNNEWQQIDLARWNLPVLAAVINKLEGEKGFI